MTDDDDSPPPAVAVDAAGGYTQDDIDAEIKRLDLDGFGPYSSVVEGRAFINGEYVNSVGNEWLTTSNPATGQVVAKIASCDQRDVDLAVSAARASFESGVWSNLPPIERKDILLRFATLIEQHTLELAVYDSVEAGKVIRDNLEGDVPDTVRCFQYHAEAINKLYDQVAPTASDKSLGLIRREPVGVVGLIVPWNFPLLMAAWKLAPALATGNSVVLKPAELTSLSAIRLGALAVEAGIPPGVLNVLPGLGVNAGAAVAQHDDIDMVGFTGSTIVGRSILKAAAESNLKRVSLELGGKSPQIVFDDNNCDDDDDDDLDRIADHVMSAAFWNQSENCSCGSRLLVQKGIKEKLLNKLVEKAQSKDDWVFGDPTQLSSNCGSMISPQHCDKVLKYIEKGIAEGATCILGGPQRILGGDFCGITILDHVDNSSTVAQDEIFGPVLSVITFETEEEAIRLANDTRYGLAASLYTPNVHRAHRVARRLRAGNVSVNCFSEGDDTTPFGGYRQSGFVGRDKSVLAHEQYQEIKTVWYEMLPEK